MTKARLKKVNEVLERRQIDLTVILDGVHKPHNVAAIVRSCDAVGVSEVHMVRPRCGFSQHHMTSGGANKWVLSHRYEVLDQAVTTLKHKGFQIVAAHKSDKAISYERVDYCKPTALLMGAELYGIDRGVLDQADQEVYIPMMGMVESFNVSVACSILLTEAQRQRQLAGRYDKPSLDLPTLERLRFEWLHPKVAEQCRRQQKPYPFLDEEGDIYPNQV